MRDSFKREESISLLYSIVPGLKTTSEEGLSLLAERLGDSPLALDLAGRYLASDARVSIPQYLVTVERTASTLSPALKEWIRNNPGRHLANLPVVLVITLENLPRFGLSRDAFTVAVLGMPGAVIPINLLKSALNCGGHEMELYGALHQLYQFGLLERTSQGPILRPQLAEIARYVVDLVVGQPERVLPGLAEALLKMSCSAEGPLLSSPAYPHLRPVARRAEQAGLKQAGKLWKCAGYHLRAAAEYQQARTCFERALACEEKILGAGHPETAALQNDLGQVLYELGNLEEAKNCFSQAMLIHETADGYGLQHPAVAGDSINLGRVLFDLGNLDGAQACYELALSIYETAFGPDHLKVAGAAGKLGRVLHARGEIARAKACFKRQLAIEEAAYGPSHRAVTATLNALGLALQDLGQLTEARDCFERALAVDEKTCGPGHPDVARDLNNLGSVYRGMGDLPKAAVLFRQALAIQEKSKGARSHDIATTANNLGRVLYSLDDLEGARQCFERVLANDEKGYGPESSQVASDLTNLGIVLHEMGSVEEARTSYERVLAILKKTLPANHPSFITLNKYLERLNIAA